MTHLDMVDDATVRAASTAIDDALFSDDAFDNPKGGGVHLPASADGDVCFFAVSNKTGAGIAALRDAIDAVAERQPEVSQRVPFTWLEACRWLHKRGGAVLTMPEVAPLLR
eukprot:gene17912-35274_t